MTKVKCHVCCMPISGAVSVCADCETPHHLDCWRYFGSCAIYGCSQRATAKEKCGLQSLLNWHLWYTKLLLSVSLTLGFILLSPIVIAPFILKYGWLATTGTIGQHLQLPTSMLSFASYSLLMISANHIYFQLRLGYLVYGDVKASFRSSVTKELALSSALGKFEPMFSVFVRYVKYGCFVFWTAMFISFVGRIYGQSTLIGIPALVLQDTFCIYLILVSPIVLTYSNLAFLRKLHRPEDLLAADGKQAIAAA